MKRWIIRSFFIGVLLLCLGGLVGSFLYSISINYQSKSRNLWNAYCFEGRTYFKWSDSHENDVFWNTFEYENGWSVVTNSSNNQPIYDDPYYDPIDPHLLGFLIENQHHHILFAIPFWFPTAISAGLLWWVWRKTRAKAMGRAFPVEVDKAVKKVEP